MIVTIMLPGNTRTYELFVHIVGTRSRNGKEEEKEKERVQSKMDESRLKRKKMMKMKGPLIKTALFSFTLDSNCQLPRREGEKRRLH